MRGGEEFCLSTIEEMRVQTLYIGRWNYLRRVKALLAASALTYVEIPASAILRNSLRLSEK